MLKASFGLAVAAWAILFVFGSMILFCCKPDIALSFDLFFKSLIEVAYIAACPAVVVFTFGLLLLRRPVS